MNLSKSVFVFAGRVVRRRLAAPHPRLHLCVPIPFQVWQLRLTALCHTPHFFFFDEPDRDGGALPQLRDPVSRQMRRGDTSATADTAAAEQVSISSRRSKQLVQAVYHRAARRRRQPEVEVAGPPIAGWREQQEGAGRKGRGDRRPRVRVSEGTVMRVLGVYLSPVLFGDVQVLRVVFFSCHRCAVACAPGLRVCHLHYGGGTGRFRPSPTHVAFLAARTGRCCDSLVADWSSLLLTCC